MVVFIAILVASAGTTLYLVANQAEGSGGGLLASFAGYDELSSFLKNAREAWRDRYEAWGSCSGFCPATATFGTGDLLAMETKVAYSSTNVQVEGVDEGDIVKTDGEFLYLASADRVTIVRAYPPGDMKIVSSFEARETLKWIVGQQDIQIIGLFILSERLAVISTTYGVAVQGNSLSYGTNTTPEPLKPDVIGPTYEPRTFVSIFDLRDVSKPSLISSFGISGWSVASRMVSGHVYIVSQSSVWTWGENFSLPQYCVESRCEPLSAGRIHYDPESRDAAHYLNILAVDVGETDYEAMSIVTGYTSVVYMSSKALYLTFQKWRSDVVLLDSRLSSPSSDTIITTIYKVRVEGLRMQIAARGDVVGWLLNQFSMDERTPYLRVATTTSWSALKNNVYVLDEDLKIIGALQNLAPSERIYSARFVGDALYLVTFRQVDPFFIIDLRNPYKPHVLGELKIPGFSSYLHPVDEAHVLGIGLENRSVKISLFDVSDTTKPVEADRYIVRGSYDSPVLHDHKALLFDREREILAIPISTGSPWDSWAYYGSSAYVFRVSADHGIYLRGIISHGAGADVRRSLYIDDFLYTISGSLVKSNSLFDLKEANSLVYRTLSEEPVKFWVDIQGEINA